MYRGGQISYQSENGCLLNSDDLSRLVVILHSHHSYKYVICKYIYVYIMGVPTEDGIWVTPTTSAQLCTYIDFRDGMKHFAKCSNFYPSPFINKV